MSSLHLSMWNKSNTSTYSSTSCRYSVWIQPIVVLNTHSESGHETEGSGIGVPSNRERIGCAWISGKAACHPRQPPKNISGSFATHSPKISGEYLPVQSFPIILSYFLFLWFTSLHSIPWLYRSRALSSQNNE